MASSILPIKALCATCGHKGVGIFKCEGCTQVFCRKHVVEHRDILSHQLDEVVVDYDTLQQTMFESEDKQNYRHSLIQQIDKWERDSIVKIQQTAEEARKQVQQLINSQKERFSNELHDLGKQLRRARENDDFVETDLQTWTSKLGKLKHDINAALPAVSIREDTTKLFIGKMYVSIIRQAVAHEEQFGDYFGDIQIEDSGRIVSHSGSDRSDAYVRGKGEYSKGKHQIRFTMNKKTTLFVMSFNVVSKLHPVSRTSSDAEYFPYGWRTDDGINNPDGKNERDKSFKDLKGETKFELEFIIDCDNRKISYFNEQTRQTREMNVNIDKCPFPWQLEFYLFNVGDRIQIVSSIKIS